MDAKRYNQRLANRLETLLRKEADPLPSMDLVAQAAEAGGLVDDSNNPRRSRPDLFASDLLLENPVALDWTNARLETMPDPLTMPDLGQLADRLK